MNKQAPGIVITVLLALLAGLFSWPSAAYAGNAVWSAETIPGTEGHVIGPSGIDVRDCALAGDGIIYAVPGDSVSDNVVYKSTDDGMRWTELGILIEADIVAVAPDNADIVALASRDTPSVLLTLDGGSTWSSLGTPQQSGATAASAIHDIAISPASAGKRYIAAAGTEAGGIGNAWYYDPGATVPTWMETNILSGFSAASEVAAVTFSPRFTEDFVMLAVTGAAGASVRLQVFSLNSLRWNGAAAFLDYPVTLVSNSGITGLASASLSLSPDYAADTPGTRIVFVGLTIEGNATAVSASGIYRCVNTTVTMLKSNTRIHSIGFTGSYLAAGSYNSANVYRSDNPLAVAPEFRSVMTTKAPGGENRVVIAWSGSDLIAGTSGNESAFAVSTDRGATFNDFSLIDTALTNVEDVAVSSDGGTVYLVTDDGTDLSVWRREAAWKRIFGMQGARNYIVRLTPGDADAVYLAGKGSTALYHSSDGGETGWLPRTCPILVRDLAVESNGVIYAIDTSGSVSKSTDAGFVWGQAMPTLLGTGASIVSAGDGVLLAGGQDGYVAYSEDGNASWTRIYKPIQSGAGHVQVVADENFGSNRIIYAASSAPGQNIMKWQIGTSTDWADIFPGTIPGGIYGMVIDHNTLYALQYNPGNGQSTLWMHISPAAATASSPSWSSSYTTPTTDADDTRVHLNAVPRALKASNYKLWAVKTNGTGKLYSFADFSTGLALQSPASGFVGRMNVMSGGVYDITFTWRRPAPATAYELEIAADSGFTIHVATVPIATVDDNVVLTVGPGQSGAARVDFMPNTTYYWRTHMTQPVYGRYSETRSFTIEPLVDLPLELLAPVNGSSGIGQSPAFSWKPVSGAEKYQFMLSIDGSMESPLIDAEVTSSAFTVPQELDYGTTYFWRVRAIAPAPGNWSTLANFTVKKAPVEPAPPITVEQGPQEIITIPEPPPQTVITIQPAPENPEPFIPGYLVAIIIIAAVLLAAVVALIFIPLPARIFPTSSLTKQGARETAAPSGSGPGSTGRLRSVTTVLAGSWRNIISAVTKRKPRLSEAADSDGSVTGVDETVLPLSFAVRSFLWMTSSPDDGDEQKLTAEEEKELGGKLASRIKDMATGEPLYRKYPQEAAQFLHIWARYGSREETVGYLIKSFEKRPDNVLAFLRCFITAPTGAETTPAGPGFMSAHYEALAQIIEPESVYAALAALYGQDLDTASTELPGNPADAAVSRQFAAMYHRRKS